MSTSDDLNNDLRSTGLQIGLKTIEIQGGTLSRSGDLYKHYTGFGDTTGVVEITSV